MHRIILPKFTKLPRNYYETRSFSQLPHHLCFHFFSFASALSDHNGDEHWSEVVGFKSNYRIEYLEESEFVSIPSDLNFMLCIILDCIFEGFGLNIISCKSCH